MSSDLGQDTDAFTAFVGKAEPRLRRALVATYGPVVGREAALDALSWAWEHWQRLAPMANPVGYLYRVGQTAARRHTTSRPGAAPDTAPPMFRDDREALATQNEELRREVFTV